MKHSEEILECNSVRLSFEDTFKHHSTLLSASKRLCKKSNLSETYAEDFVNDVYIKLNHKVLQCVENPQGFLIEMLRGVINTYIKRIKKGIEIVNAYSQENHVYGSYEPEYSFDDKSALHDYLEREMPTKYWQPLRLRAEGNGYSSIARLLQLDSENTAKTRFHRARRIAQGIITSHPCTTTIITQL